MTAMYPQGTDGLYQHLGVGESEHGHEEHAEPTMAPAHLPMEPQVPAEPPVSEPVVPVKSALIARDAQTNTVTVYASQLNIGKILKDVFPYIAIFAISLVTYFAFFTNASVLTAVKGYFNKPKPATAIQAAVIPADQVQAYKDWIGSYFYDVSDSSITDPNNDISGNGLTNYQKFLLGLNPKKKSTAGLSMSDTDALMKGIDPLTGGPITDKEKQIVANNIDLEAISNKMSLAAANAAPQVAGASTSSGDRQGLDLNTDVTAQVNIPALNITVPLIWTKDVNDFDKDLPNGLVHYPGTPLPGQIGTSYISGHSSNYVWIKGKYNNVFAHLDKLKKFDSFSLTATTADGKQVTFHYVVTSMGLFNADDQSQFANIGKSTIALSTCWPVGTSAQRYVVFAQLTQTDNPG